MATLPRRTHPGISGIGELKQPTSGRVEITDIIRDGNTTRVDFRLLRARVPVTDATTNGSYGSFTLFQFGEQAIAFTGSRQNYTAYASDGTGVPNDTAFEIGIGSVAIAAAADGTLGSGANQDIGKAIAQTLVAGTTTGQAVTACAAANGTSTPCKLALNVSGTAETVDGTGWLDVTGTVSVAFSLLGDH